MAAWRRFSKAVFAAADVVRPPAAGVTILLYHRVGARSGGQVDQPLELFRDQVAELAATCDVLSLGGAVPVLAGRADAPERPAVVLTFDDGTADFVDAALPVLVEHGLPATLYLTTAPVEQQRPFWGTGPALTWSALREAVSTGLVTVGSHTHTHPLLDRLAPREAAEDVDRSVGLIGERLGLAVEHFAYPKAVAPGSSVEALVRSRFVTAALSGTRANVPGSTDLHRLRRSPIQVSDDMRWFRRKVEGGMALEDDLRTLLNRRRYRALTH